MGYDGTLNFDTSIDSDGFQQGMSSIGSIAQGALGVLVGNLLTKAIDGITQLGQTAIDSGGQFETGMAKVSTLFTGTEQELADLGTALLEMSSASGQSSDVLAEAAYTAESASVAQEDLAAMIDRSTKLAVAGYTDVDTALSATAKTMNAYGMTGEDAISKVQTVLIQTQNKGITTVNELGASLAQVTPTAAAFGVGFDQVGASLAAMTAQGTPTAQATTQLNALIAELGKSGTQAAKNLTAAAEGTQYAGMSFSEMMDAGATLDDVLAMMNDSAKESGVTLVDMFSSIDAGKGALSVFNQEGAVFREDLEAMGTSADVVGDAYGQMSDTMEFKSQQIQTSLQNLAAMMYQEFSGKMAEGAGIAADSIGRLQSAFSEGGFSGMLQEGVTIAGELIQQLGQSIIENTPQLIQFGIQMAGNLVNGIMSAMPGMTTAAVQMLNTLTQGIKDNLPQLIPAALNTLVQFSGSLRENVGQIVDAGLELIMALGQSLIDNIPVMVETIPTIVTNIAGIINDNAPKLLSCGIQLIAKLAMGLIQAIPTIIANIPKIIQAIVSVLMAFNWINLGKQIITFIGNGIKTLATAIPNLFKSFCTNAKSIVTNFGWASLGRGIITVIGNGIRAVITAIPTLLKTIATNGMNFIKGIDWFSVGTFLIEGIISGIGSIKDAALGAITGVGDTILNGFKSFFGIASPSTVMEEQGEFIGEGVLNGIAALPDKVAEIFSNILDGAVTWGQNMISNVTESVTNLVSSAVSTISSLPGQIAGFLSEVLNNAVTWGSSMVSQAQTAASDFLSKIEEFVSQIPGKVSDFLSETLSNAVSWGSDMLSAGADAAKQMYDAVVDGVSGLPGEMLSVGADIINGIGDGIWSAIGGLYDTIHNALSGLVDQAKNALGIASPSKVMAAEVGKWVLPGVGTGVAKTLPKVKAQLADTMGELATAMQKEVTLTTGKVGTELATGSRTAQTATAGSNNKPAEVNISGEIHTHVDLDGKEIGHTVTPIVDQDFARIDTHKKRGG